MEYDIEDLLEDYSIFFKSGKFDLEQFKKEFAASEYYSTADNKRHYDLNDILDSEIEEGAQFIVVESFDQYIDKHLSNAGALFRERLLQYIRKINSVIKQNAVLYSTLADLQNYINILSETEDEHCKYVMEEVIKSRGFILSLFSEQLGMSVVEKHFDRRNSLSSYYRGIRKLQFNLQKNEVTLLFLLLMDSNLMAYPISDNDLALFLDNNVQYYYNTTGNFSDIKNSKVEISKVRDEGHEIQKEYIIKKLKETFVMRKKK